MNLTEDKTRIVKAAIERGDKAIASLDAVQQSINAVIATKEDFDPPVQHVALQDMSPDQLAEAAKGLEAMQQQCDTMSGICATLNGLVFLEAKKKSQHGEWKNWLKLHFPKSYRTAANYMAVAKLFLKSAPRDTFEQMTLALSDGKQSMDSAALDMTHPVVSQVAKWTKGRSFREIRDEIEGGKGGNTYDRENGKGERTELTPEEAAELLQTLCKNTAQHLSAIHSDKAYVALTEAELDGLIDHCQTIAEEAKAWKKLTQAERETVLAERVAKDTGGSLSKKEKKAKK